MRHLNDKALAEELVMDVLFWLWQKRHEIGFVENLQAYLFRATRNAVIDCFRKRSAELVSLEEAAMEKIADTRMADYHLKNTEQQHRYQQILEQLSPQRKRIFKMSREEELSYAEIAKKQTFLSIL